MLCLATCTETLMADKWPKIKGIWLRISKTISHFIHPEQRLITQKKKIVKSKIFEEN